MKISCRYSKYNFGNPFIRPCRPALAMKIPILSNNIIMLQLLIDFEKLFLDWKVADQNVSMILLIAVLRYILDDVLVYD